MSVLTRREFTTRLALAAGVFGTDLSMSAEPPPCKPLNAGGLTEADFRDYVSAFNRDDFDGFGRFYSPQVNFEGQGGQFNSRADVLAFYRRVKARVRETLTIRDLVVGTGGIAADMVTELHALEDWPDFPTGPIMKGETRRSENFIWYEVADRRFTHIRSAHYQSGDDVTVPKAAVAAAADSCLRESRMTEQRFSGYIDAFNRDDTATYGAYYQDDVALVIAGKTELRGRQAIFDFYRSVKSETRRTIQINKVITAPDRLAVELQSEFLALQDLPNFTAGPMTKGGRIFINTFVLYELRDGKFARIRSAVFRKVARP